MAKGPRTVIRCQNTLKAIRAKFRAMPMRKQFTAASVLEAIFLSSNTSLPSSRGFHPLFPVVCGCRVTIRTEAFVVTVVFQVNPWAVSLYNALIIYGQVRTFSASKFQPYPGTRHILRLSGMSANRCCIVPAKLSH